MAFRRLRGQRAVEPIVELFFRRLIEASQELPEYFESTKMLPRQIFLDPQCEVSEIWHATRFTKPHAQFAQIFDNCCLTQNYLENQNSESLLSTMATERESSATNLQLVGSATKIEASFETVHNPPPPVDQTKSHWTQSPRHQTCQSTSRSASSVVASPASHSLAVSCPTPAAPNSQLTRISACRPRCPRSPSHPAGIEQPTSSDTLF